MKNDNSSYTVTPPDLFLPENGITTLIISEDTKLVDDIKLLFEKYIMSSMVFNIQNKTTSGNLSWMYNISTHCDFMIIDIDTCKWEDIIAALLKEQDENHQIIFISPRNKKRDAIRLLNAKSKFLIFSNVVQLDTYLKIETMPGSLHD